METLTRSSSIRDRVKGWRDGGQRVALVPTLGTLHKGHMSLVAEAQECADQVIVSVVAAGRAEGPLLETDRELLVNVGAQVLFMPPMQELFPIGRESSAVVTLPGLSDVLEGAAKPEYFATALTTLTKLFNLVRPEVAVFGERDYQQLILVRRLVTDLFLPIEIVGCPTLRESDGVAIASVNRELNAGQRSLAPLLYATLGQMAARIDGGERDYQVLERQGLQRLNSLGFQTDYFAIRQAADLTPVKEGVRELVLLAAVRLDEHRLKDSLPIGLIDRF